MINFSDVFSENKIVATVSQLLIWSHIVELIPIKDANKRDFYDNKKRTKSW